MCIGLTRSFNKVNDLFATTSDPGAWEFRHPLFRRGEPHLLASIKRKTTRPSTTDAGPGSPTDEDVPRPIAGWMRDTLGQNSQQDSVSTNSPLPAFDPPPRPFGLPRDSVQTRTPNSLIVEQRPWSRDGQWDNQGGQTTRMPPPPIHPPASSDSGHSSHRYHPDPPRRFSTERTPVPYTETYYPQPQHSPIDTLTNQVATLEDKVQRLSHMISYERLANVRSNLDLSSYLLQLSGCVGDGQGG